MIAYHQQLLDPAAYPEQTTTVTFKETHISRLYLTDSRVYKLKKPLDLGFLDFSTLERRRHFCAEEVRLNRRFAPAVYLDVVELCVDDGRVRFSGPGELLDYAVCMRRLPEARMLDQMVADDAARLPEEMDRLAEALDTLFDKAEICHDPEGPNPDVVASNCRENFTQTAALSGTLLSKEAHRLMNRISERDLSNLAGLFRQREAEGFVRDGHGDLHSGNICMTDPIQVYDCIEFNRRFRVADIAADLAFLLMDLEFRGRRDLADRLLLAYQALAMDPDLERLLPFYKRYRAWVRGKVDGMLANEAETAAETRAAAAQLARRYFNLAMGYALAPALFLTCGLMGSGKTVLARALSRATGAELLRSDVLRKEMAGIAPDQPAHNAYLEGLYTPAMSERTYQALYERARDTLSRSRSVIVDAAFTRQELRQRFEALAVQTGKRAWLLHLTCPDQVAKVRLVARRGDVSDGRRELYKAQKQDFARVEPAPHVISIDSTHDVDYNVQIVLCRALSHQEDVA